MQSKKKKEEAIVSFDSKNSKKDKKKKENKTTEGRVSSLYCRPRRPTSPLGLEVVDALGPFSMTCKHHFKNIN
jgi:hypothetical protein